MNDNTEKEIIHQLDMVVPESFYTKPIYGRVTRKFRIPILILVTVEIILSSIIFHYDKSTTKAVWLLPLFLTALITISSVGLSFSRRKTIRKILATKENCFTYTFYSDCVMLKNPTAELVLDYNSTEFYAEDKKRLVITFALDRKLYIDKTQCSEEQLDFIRRIVAAEKQKKTEKHTLIKSVFHLLILSALVVLIAWSLVIFIKAENNRYTPRYASTTYESFEGCLAYGTITDVVIIKDKFVEYTYTGYDEDVRYYTTCEDTDELIEKMDELGIDWEKE